MLKSDDRVSMGQRVRCILGYGDVLIPGQIYTVYTTSWDPTHLFLKEAGGIWRKERFELADDRCLLATVNSEALANTLQKLLSDKFISAICWSRIDYGKPTERFEISTSYSHQQLEKAQAFADGFLAAHP